MSRPQRGTVFEGTVADAIKERASDEPQFYAQPQPFASCPYITRGDTPHISANLTDISVHGWWETGNASLCPTHADIAVWLYGYWCDPWGCRWLPIDQNEERVRPRNIYNERVNARRLCASDQPVSFRVAVDADLVGVIDAPYIYLGPPVDRPCYPG